MDISLREWLIILGVFIIALVVLDGFRRARKARRESLEISQGMGGSIEGSPLDDDFNPELPGGGFRVVRQGADSGRYRAEADERAGGDNELEAEDTVAPNGADQADREPYSDAPRHADMSAQPVTDGQESDEEMSWSQKVMMSSEDERTEPGFDSIDDLSEPLRAEPQWQDDPEFAEEPMSARDDSVPEESEDDQQGLQAEVADRPTRVQEKASEFKDRFLKKITSNVDAIQESLSSHKSRSGHGKPHKGSRKQQKKSANKDSGEEIIVVNVLARNGEEFDGLKLRHLVEACGMQIGDMSIYHRHEYDFDQGPVQFSMANAVKPGTFGRDMDETSTPGVSFFIRLPGPDDSMQAFDYMIETAQCIVRNLGGELKDENLSVMTSQTIEHCRNRVREFERRQLSSKV